MGRTPDTFPGERIEESILFEHQSEDLPDTPGEVLFVSSSVSGSGHFFRNVDQLERTVPVPSQVGQVLYCLQPGTFSVATPITSENGWLVNDDGTLLVHTD